MASYTTVILLYSTLLFISIGGISGAENDDIFQEYLLNAMESYTTWLNENSLDPTKPITDPLTIESTLNLTVAFKCELRNQKVTGHSSNSNQIWETASSFSEHEFSASRQQNHSYQLEGSFNCAGRLSALEEVFPFSGEGTYQLTTSKMNEIAIYSNLGITDDYKLNFSLSYIDYGLFPTFSKGLLSGNWNDSRINDTYIDDVVAEFIYVYRAYLINPARFGVPHLHPTMPLLTGYLLNVTRELNLTTILNEENLPLPHIPTPTPLPLTTTSALISTTKVTETPGETTTNIVSTTTSAAALAYISKPFLLVVVFYFLIL